jgi:hypothetical protein
MKIVTFRKEKSRKTGSFTWNGPVWYLNIDGCKNNEIFIYSMSVNRKIIIYAIKYNEHHIPVLTFNKDDYFKTLLDAKHFLVDYLNK